MTAFVKIFLLLFVGLALGIAYNAWPLATTGLLPSPGPAANAGVEHLEMFSYATGLIVGMMLWQIGTVQWGSMPARLQSYLLSQMQLYQFVLMGGACLAVLIYF